MNHESQLQLQLYWFSLRFHSSYSKQYLDRMFNLTPTTVWPFIIELCLEVAVQNLHVLKISKKKIKKKN